MEGGRERVHDRRSMNPRFRNANLLIIHVLDSCVKLLAVHVAHIKYTGSISGPLCGDRNWLKENDRHYVYCIIHQAVPHTQLYVNAVLCAVCDVLAPCMHHNGALCLGSKLGRQHAPCS